MTTAIAIAGGGVAGLTLAAGLRARQLSAEVLEAADPVADDGRVLCLWGGALAALHRAGLSEIVWAHGSPIDRLRLWQAGRHVLLDVAAPEAAVHGLAITRSALRQALRHTSEDVPLHAGRAVIAYAEDDYGVVATLHGGAPVRASVLIGADGAFSAVRAQCLDDGPPVYSGDTVWEGSLRASNGDQRTLDLFWGPHGVRGGAMPLADGERAWWIAADTGPIRADPTMSQHDELRAVLEDMEGELPAWVAATDEARIHRSDVFARREVQTGRGRVTLVGDAGHPLPMPLPLGGSLAVEDAIELAEALAAEPNPVEALRAYEQRRAPRLSWASAAVWRLRVLEVRDGPLSARARELLLEHRADHVRDFLSRLLIGLPAQQRD